MSTVTLIFFNFIFFFSFINVNISSYNLIEKQEFGFQFFQAVQLINDNILFIAKDGIYIYNYSDFTTPKSKVSLTLYYEYRQKITLSQYKDGYIISILINDLYFFSPTGSVIKSVNLKNDIITKSEYYCITAFDIIDNVYYFFISFVNTDYYLSLYYYKIDNSTLEITEVYEYIYKPTSSEGIETTLGYKTHSCELMIYSKEKVLTCFFEASSSKAISTASFKIVNNAISYLNLKSFSNTFDNYGPLKSSANTEDFTKTLICICDQKNLHCLNFDISKNSFQDE